jgi:Phasin protein
MQPMSERISRDSWAEALSPFSVPAFALNICNPFFIGMTKSNGHAAEGFATLFSEWQNFVAHRLQEDLLLAQKMASAKTPDAIIAAYAEFWQKAAADYAQEYATIGKLYAGIVGRVISQAQSATVDAANPHVVAKAA